MASSIYATPPPDLNNKEDGAIANVSTTSTASSASTTVTSPSMTAASRRTDSEAPGISDIGKSERIESPETIAAAPIVATGAGAIKKPEILNQPQQSSSQSSSSSSSSTGMMINDDDNYRRRSFSINKNKNPKGNHRNAESPIDGDSNLNNNGCSSRALAAMAAAAANAAIQLQLIEAINDVNYRETDPKMGPDLMKSNCIMMKDNYRNVYQANLIEKLPKNIDYCGDVDGVGVGIGGGVMGMVHDTEENISIKEGGLRRPHFAETYETDDFLKQVSSMEDDGGGAGGQYKIYCSECGENFENDNKLNDHRLQEHKDRTERNESDGAMRMKVKEEVPDLEDARCVGNERNQPSSPPCSSSSSSSWLRTNLTNFANLNFPFLSTNATTGMIMPLLGLNASTLTNIEGLQRSQLRIFNPEAFCELCNKEFCNKYFLKTHKANKHGIYESTADIAHSSSTNNLLSINHLLQMQQMQQLQQQRNPQGTSSMEAPNKDKDKDKDKEAETASQQLMTTNPGLVHCDICSKRFTNLFAMRRHRAKLHESTTETPSTTSSQMSSFTQANEMGQEGLAQELSLEQEYVSFTPQPHKLSPQSQQLARESNFAHDKLRRLGVLNPDAFCELCCKEYCNKYFLRTHKWRRHGIYMPPDDADNDNQNQNQNQKMPSWPLINVPLNMMTTSATTTGDDGEIRRETSNKSQAILKKASDQSTEDNLDKSPRPLKRIKLEAGEAVDCSATLDGKRSETNPEMMMALEATEGTNVSLQNLQKLQTILQHLTDLNETESADRKRVPPCSQNMETQYALQNEHNAIAAGTLKQSPNSSPSSSANVAAPSGDLRCTACSQDFATLNDFHKHIAEIHLLPIIGSDGFATPERPTSTSTAAAAAAALNALGMPLTNTRTPYAVTPTNSYCEICNKELCNKYFMKTHMQRMHGIEIENGAQIGGVVCDICNKELCSKYFLRVHKNNTHGITEEVQPAPQQQQPTQKQNGINLEGQSPQSYTANEGEAMANAFPGASGSSTLATAPADNKTDWSNGTNEICPLCTKRFRSTKWLRIHLQNDHNSKGGNESTAKSTSTSKTSSPISKTPKTDVIITTDSLSIPVVPAATYASSLQSLPSTVQLAQALHNLSAQNILLAGQQQSSAAVTGFKEYQCSYCSFATPYYAFLYIHEKTHSIETSAIEMKKKHHTNQDPDQESIKDKNYDGNYKKSDAVHEETITAYQNLLDLESEKQINRICPSINENDDERMKRGRSIHDPSSPIQSVSDHFVGHKTSQKSNDLSSYGLAVSSRDAPQMQAFRMEPEMEMESENEKSPFVPTIVYLPVRERLSDTVSITFKLTPS